VEIGLEDYLSEREQIEGMRLWLKENAAWLLLALAIPFAVFGGKAQWQRWHENQALGASVRYTQLLDALSHGDRTGARKLGDALRAESSKSPYADQGDLALARAAVEANELADAETLLARVMTSGLDDEIRLIARLRLARVQRAEGHIDQGLATLQGVDPKGFLAVYAELRGDFLLQKGDRAGALAAYREAVAAGGKGTIDEELVGYKIADLAGAVLPPPAKTATDGGSTP
jgi:predicted negative regulator of RcsB-dependent stress response